MAGVELRGAGVGLLDDELALRVRGAGPGQRLAWRGRLRDDDGRVWRAGADRSEDLPATWTPAKAGARTIAALQSLRPVSLELRADAPDGRSASRTVERRLVGEGVQLRRWREGIPATLHRPADAQPCATVVLDGSAGEHEGAVATLAAPLLASRGVLVLALLPARAGGAAGAEAIAGAAQRLTAVPGAGEVVVLAALDPLGDPGGDGVVLPPGVPAQDTDPGAAAARGAAWDALLDRLGARPRRETPDDPD